jgi:hypothetical protein
MKPRFNYTKMRAQFYAWHGGQESPLYAAASSGLVGDTLALQTELQVSAQWCRAAQAGYTRDAAYLRRVADALPDILSPPGVAHDGRTYRCLPWAKVAGRFPLDFMHPAIEQEG